MFKMIRRAALAAGLLFGVCGAMQPSVFAQEHASVSGNTTAAGYTLASLQGNYSATGTYGANVALALGTQTMDGKGHLWGHALVNQPGANGGRSVSRISFSGTYIVRPDGSGKFLLTLALPGGTTAHATEDFLITEAAVVRGRLLGTKVVDAQQQPAAAVDGGVFVTHTYVRRP